MIRTRALLIALVSFSACQKQSETVIQPVQNEKAVNDSIYSVTSKTGAALEKKRLMQSFPSSDFIPTGWYAPAGAEVKVNLGKTRGSANPTLIIGTYNRNGTKILPQLVNLEEGLNTVKVDKGGLVFIRYEDNDAVSESILKFLSGFVRAPFFIADETKKDDWQKQLNTYVESPDAVLFGKKIIIVVSRQNAIKYVNQDQNLLLSNANKIWEYEEDFSGLDNSSAVHTRNIHNHLMTECSDRELYMAAFNYGSYYNYETGVENLTVPETLNNKHTWHELGHHHQLVNYKWDAVVEVTNNVYSYYVEKRMGFKKTSITTSTRWPAIKTYLQDSTAKDYDKIEDRYVRLGMFYQLMLAYSDEFYIKLHKKMREEALKLNTDAEKKRYFMLKACEISGNDLTSFFKAWGMSEVDDVYTEIKALKLPNPSKDITSFTD